jgi:ribonuclease G
VQAAAAEPELESLPSVPPPSAVTPPQQDQANRDDDRRGRRSRRRRRGGRGFPDSKYAAAPSTEPASEVAGEVEAEAPAEWESAARAEASEPAAPSGEIFQLPGESLAKYRRPAGREEPEEDEESDPASKIVISSGDTPTPEEVAEEVLDRVEEIEEMEDAAAAETESETPDEAPETDEAPEREAGEGESGADAEAGAKPETATDEVEPARMPHSLTATLREQGNRFAHRVGGRRVRRRGGRGGPPPPLPAGAPETGGQIADVVRPAADRPERNERSDRGDRGERPERERPPLPSIADLLKEGQEIIVQIAKEPLGQKGARITSHIALPGRYVVYMPTVEHLGVSRKISTDEERLRLKRILLKHREGMPGGFIMRTAGEGKTEDDIASDMRYLGNLWLDIRTKAEKRRAPALLHHDVQVVERLLRDQLTEGFKAVWVDNEELYQNVLHGVERMQPSLLSRVKLYTRSEPIFDAFGITQELEKALRPKVWLKSGGYIVINQTEALVAIDVNTGKYVGKSNRLEDTIVKTNLEAVKEISRQVRLRDLGGIIVVDFIDMDERKNRQKVMQALEDAMRFDKAPYKILQFNDFGLVAITRKRVKQSLERSLCSPCPYCEGAGYVKSVQTTIGDILAQAQKYAKVVDGKECVLRCSPEVAKTMKSVENRYLEELEETLGRPVLVVSDATLHQEKFDLT